eukprot:1335619-Pleurochrysis_carterae.AAC.8
MASSILKEMGCEGEQRAALAAGVLCDSQGGGGIRAPTPPRRQRLVLALACVAARIFSLVLFPPCFLT